MAVKYHVVPKQVVRLWPFGFILLWMAGLTFYGQVTLDDYISNSNLQSLATEYNVDFNTTIQEKLIGNTLDNYLLIQESVISQTEFKKMFKAKYVKPSTVTYFNLPNDTHLYLKYNNVSNPEDPKTGVSKYFEAIKVQSEPCEKLARIGGRLFCNSSLGDENGMDGHKLICMKRNYRIGSRNFQNCLILSFGVHTDTSFDEAIADLNCDVHMFDILNYEKLYFKGDKQLHFHQVGLGLQRYRNINPTTNVSMDFDTLESIIVSLGVQNKLINVLKLDIEGSEWDVLHDLSSKAYLDTIGQIAVEIHAMELLSLSHEEQLKKVENWISIIEALEGRGFRRAAYWDNNQPEYAFTDSDGTRFESFGEMLLINHNWRNETFMKELATMGYTGA